ncbi:molybdenum cofactor guanylyltransferase [Candidatus Poribacteria bacterium]|nr:molybdenum cofactor guanylyltransferase [Candidatus Poribacteria bacterium]
MQNQLTGVILAGGKSLRMGYNKALLHLGNQTIIQRVLASLKQVTSSQLIVTNFPEEYEFLNIPMKSDILSGKGAFGGIYTGLSASETPYCLVVACDMPFLNVDLLRYMTQVVKEYDIVIPKHSKGYEPLCAIYAKSCMPHIEKLLKANQLRIIEVFSYVRVREISEAEIKSYDVDDLMFFNINTQEDYQHALQIVKRKT